MPGLGLLRRRARHPLGRSPARTDTRLSVGDDVRDDFRGPEASGRRRRTQHHDRTDEASTVVEVGVDCHLEPPQPLLTVAGDGAADRLVQSAEHRRSDGGPQLIGLGVACGARASGEVGRADARRA